MFRDILANKGVLAGSLFCILIVVGNLLYSWHVERGIKADEAKTQQFLQEIETEKENHPVQDTRELIDTQTLDSMETPVENEDTQAMSEGTDALPADNAESVDLADAFLPDGMVSAEEETAEVPVSPFGFGAYPEVPEGWPADIWPRKSADHELMVRVQIKLISQGINALGAIMEDGLVYPTIDDTVYIRWDEEAGERYVSETAGDAEACERLESIIEARGDDFTEADIPSDIKIVSYEEAGIDPYTFLNLP